ncbi:MAG: leucyl aminopeptidase family protein [Alphaproteobacteria bacterium]|nr:leucyl aminopeptidase family protein [Alphaproteobacteria bacterium]MCB9929543.1 leucyl aminopeptidase family protein [Alphaproteobacteria bacterium]
MDSLLVDSAAGAIPLHLLKSAEWAEWIANRPREEQQWAAATGFLAKAGSLCLIPGDDGKLAAVLAGMGDERPLWAAGGLAARLPEGLYRLADLWDEADATDIAAGFALGGYTFGRYKTVETPKARLSWPLAADRTVAEAIATGICLARDLINTPANDLGPQELCAAARTMAEPFGAEVSELVGDDLLGHRYPTVHMVGRAGDRPPRLVDIRWGDPVAPKVTLVGKGVCFDSGGLDLKPAAGMLRMKKDMGGAACVLGLAHMIMATGLKVRLRVLIPAVENLVSGNAMRPLDVVKTRKGLTVEIGNTDAEGRLVLCDALAEADTESPDMLLDCATLTGAARVALGTDLPALFCNDDALAADLLAMGESAGDPLWRLPLHKPYKELLKSDVADLNNVSEGGFGGAITAALYLEHFVSPTTSWAHIDMMAWNNSAKPGRPKGGEAQAVRGVFQMLRKRYG